MEAFLSGIWVIEMVLVDGSDFVDGFDGFDSVLMVDSYFVNGADGLDSVLMGVVVLMLSVRLCLLMLRRLRLGGSDSRVFVVMVNGIYRLCIDE